MPSNICATGIDEEAKRDKKAEKDSAEESIE